MGIIEEVEQLWFSAPSGLEGGWIRQAVAMLPRVVARLRELEAAATPKPEGPTGLSTLTKAFVNLRERTEALEAREEARGRAAWGSTGAGVTVDKVSYLPGDTPPSISITEVVSSSGHCPHTPCCFCTRRECPAEASRAAPPVIPTGGACEPEKPGAREYRVELDDDMKYESRGG